MSADRHNLVAAHARVADARQALEHAQSALATARSLRDQTETTLAAIVADESTKDAAAALDLVAAIRSGQPVEFRDEPALAEHVLRRAEAQRRHAAATKAADALAGEYERAHAELVAAEAKLADAARSVVLAEASSIAERIRQIEGDAMELRAQLGGKSGFVAQRGKLPAELLRVLSSGMDLMLNSPAWRLARTADATWDKFMAALSSDPNAELHFGGANQ